MEITGKWKKEARRRYLKRQAEKEEERQMERQKKEDDVIMRMRLGQAQSYSGPTVVPATRTENNV
jgi:hypothetical protein